MQQVWDLMMRPLVKVTTLEELKGCKDSITYLERKVDTGTLTIYAMPEGQRWPLTSGAYGVTTRFLIVRPCWTALWRTVCAEATAKRPAAIISGTPGIGKSWFANYILLQRAQLAAKSGAQTALHDSKANTITTFVGDRVTSVVQGHSTPPLATVSTAGGRPWFIVDPPTEGGQGGYLPHGHFVVMTAPPNKHHYKTLVQACKVIFYMQPWSLEQLQIVRPLMLVDSTALSAKEVKRRFGHFGGVPRCIYARNYHAWLRELDNHIHDCDWLWVAKRLYYTLSSIVPSKKHILFSYTVPNTEKPHTVKVELASPYVYQGMVSAARRMSKGELLKLGAMDFRTASAAIRWRVRHGLQWQ